MMHEFRMFALDTVKKGYPERMLRPWCVCGWLGEWTEPDTRPGLKIVRAAAQKQFMESHLEPLQVYLKHPAHVVTIGSAPSEFSL